MIIQSKNKNRELNCEYLKLAVFGEVKEYELEIVLEIYSFFFVFEWVRWVVKIKLPNKCCNKSKKTSCVSKR